MSWNGALALLLFLVAVGVSFLLQTPAGLVRRVLGSATPSVVTLVAAHSTVAKGAIPAFKLGKHDLEVVWRYEGLSFARLGLIYRVRLVGIGLKGEGRLTVTPHDRRALLTDSRLTLRSSSIGDNSGRAVFQLLGGTLLADSTSATIDNLEVHLPSLRIEGLSGVVRLDGVRLGVAPSIGFGSVTARLSAPHHDKILLDVTNAGGQMGLSGTVSVTISGGMDVDLFLRSRQEIPAPLPNVFHFVVSPEGPGWRLRQTIPLAVLL